MVEYDSTIPPGRTGKVTQEVNLHGMRGSFTKDVVVNSNAENEPSLRLHLKGTIRMVIDVTPSYIRLPLKQGQPADVTVTLNTEKPDLEVGGISFEPTDGPPSKWGDGIPVNIRYSLKRAENPGVGGQYTYTLTISMDGSAKESKRGTFAIKTNHKQKPVIEIRGIVLSGQ